MDTATPKKNILFKQCTLADLDDWFDLQQVFYSNLLDEWLGYAEQVSLTETEQASLKQWRDLLMRHVHDWNEQELSMHFIARIFSLANFHNDQFNLFAQRTIAAQINEIELSGKPDGLIASGMRLPKLPFFCLNEFKKEEHSSNDPAGQLLASMLVAQHQNKTILAQQKMPVYGCYVIGRYWYFVVLKGNKYAISADHSAIKSDIFDIVKMLKGLKELLLAQVKSLAIPKK